jgi:hypothetical protein
MEENCVNCPEDCDLCAIRCGNGYCDGDDTCSNCPEDCGSCPKGEIGGCEWGTLDGIDYLKCD